MAAHQVPLSLGFSRQECWSGLPFPSPMHARMLSRFSHVQLCMTLWTAAHQTPLSMEFSRQKYWSGLLFPSPGDLPNPGIEPRSPTLWADSLLSEPPGKPKNTGVGSLRLFQGILPTQELNHLLHWRWILYQLSYPGSPILGILMCKSF